MRFYDPDDVQGHGRAPVGVFFRTEEEYEHYREYLDEESLPKVWPLTEDTEDEEYDC